MYGYTVRPGKKFGELLHMAVYKKFGRFQVDGLSMRRYSVTLCNAHAKQTYTAQVQTNPVRYL